jgi:serine/threonine protein kinase
VRNVPPNELLPILVTELEDAESRELLLAVAEAQGEAYVPLSGAPVDARAHLLEVHAEGAEPLLLLAMPVGAPTENGFLLRLSLYDPRENVTERFARNTTREKHTTGDPLRVRPRTTTGLHRLTAGHAAALSADPPVETSQVGRLIAGKLRIEQLVGAGGMGVVYRATHLGLRMPVAVKVLKAGLQRDLDFTRRFQEEALAASRLDHPNLTRVLDFGQEPDGLVYIAMEFLDGTDVGTLIDRDGRLPLARIVEIMSQVCAGLMHMHSRGMVHSDLKPDNLLLVAGHDEDGQPIEVAKLCDFGIAVTRGVASTEVLGTPAYMSPEQCQGDDLDARSDIYACGVMLYEMATGRLPFDTPDKEAMKAFHCNMDPRAPSRIHPIDPRFESLILKALRKDRTVRHQTARELRLALRALVAPAADTHAQGPPASQAAPPRDRPVAAPPVPQAPQPSKEEPPRSTASPKASQEQRPDWLDSSLNPVAVDRTQLLADQLIRDPVRWLADFAASTDPNEFAALCKELEDVLPMIATSARLDVMWRIRSTLAVIVEEGPASPASRPSGAHRVLKALQDPTMLAPAAHNVLLGQPPARQASGLLLAAGVGGAYVLYGARTKSAPTPEVRSRFVSMMRDIGTQAFPVLRAALEKLEGRDEVAPELLIDVLDGIPPIRDDATGEIVSRFLTCKAPDIRRIATEALVRCWGERSQALLVGLLKDEDESVRISAIEGLRKIGRVDETVVRRLGAMLQPTHRMSTTLKIQAALAYRTASLAGRPTAVAILSRLLVSFPTSGQSEEALLVEMARSLLSIGPREVGAIVSERAHRQKEPLRGRLLGLLASPGGTPPGHLPGPPRGPSARG